MSQSPKNIFDRLLKARGLDTPEAIASFLNPSYESLADPFLLPDMEKAVKRIEAAKKNQENVVIYGDYDIDGLSATALLLEALQKFGLTVSTFIPSRFEEGYGLSTDAIDRLAAGGATLLITVDCGSSSIDEVAHAKKNGIDIIVTDHHTVGKTLPKAVAVVNPKRPGHSYPFRDFAGVGVAFNLVRALQIHSIRSAHSGLPALSPGQEKWLLDLVALGTVCDIVSLTGENRTLAYWGLIVMKQSRRPGLKALMAVAGIEPRELTARSLGFGLGPRLNASGRLETAQASLELLTTQDNHEALAIAQQLQTMNVNRRSRQQKIVTEAKAQAETYKNDPVLVVSHPDWSHGIIGIVASKLMETYHKPVFVLQELGDETKGSARSFGSFSLAAAVQKNKKWLITGGGHDAAAGVTLLTKNIDHFRKALNTYYKSLKLASQAEYMQHKPDLILGTFDELNEELVEQIATLEPFGNENPEPCFSFQSLSVIGVRAMGDKKQHVKLALHDTNGLTMSMLAFSAPQHFFVEPGSKINICCNLHINEWQGNRTVEGRLLELSLQEDSFSV
jgi:single-stranded-DNA-specific exonuclease